MNRNAILVLIAAVLITGGFFLIKQNKSKSNEPAMKPEDAIRQALPTAVAPGAESKVNITPQEAAPKKESHLERLKKAGYVDNPNDPYSMIKKTKTADGKDKISVMPKDPATSDYFEPLDRTVKTAEETLNSKINEHPADEISTLKSFDDTDQNSMMLLGNFRDDVTDMEFRISKVYDEEGRATDKDIVCFVAPKLGFNFKKSVNTSLLVDGTGYGLLQLSENLFIRMAWSFEKKRILHGIVLQVLEGQPRTLQFFSATENSQGLKHCD